MSDLVKTRECIRCRKFFECKGKPKDKPCVNFEERNDGNGRCQVDKDNHRRI